MKNFILICLVFALSSCYTNRIEKEFKNIDSILSPEKISESIKLMTLITSTIKWEMADDGFIKLYCNYPELYNFNFKSFYSNTNYINEYEIECKKLSGAKNISYGLIFGATDSNENKYYGIDITVEGYYIVYVVDDKIKTKIKDWTKSEYLNTGYNEINNIKAKKMEKMYIVFLNGEQVFQFTEYDFTGNKIGFNLFIGSEDEEEFPDYPVDVRFKIK